MIRGPPGRGPGQAPAPPPRLGFAAGITEAFFPFLQEERKLPELCKRYPKLHFSQDLTQSVAHWVSTHAKLKDDINMSHAVEFSLEGGSPNEFEGEEETEETTADTYSVRVMILNPKEAEVPEDGKVAVPPHVLQQMRFIVAAKDDGSILPFGGNWKKKDGDPKKDASLVKTAIRTCKESCSLDLGPCKTWTKLLEVQYRRKNGSLHRTIVFLPDVWKGLKGKSVTLCSLEKNETKEVEEDVEVEVDAEDGMEDGKSTKMIKRKVTKDVKTIMLCPVEKSLQQLLETITYETGEPTVEVALAAASIDEFLSYHSTQEILEVLRKKKDEADETAATLKRKRDTEEEERQESLEKQKEESDAKRQKSEKEDKKKAAAQKAKEEGEKDMPEAERQKIRADERELVKNQTAAKALEEKVANEEAAKRKEEEASQKKLEEEAKKRAQDEEDQARGYRIAKEVTTHVDEKVAEPFQYFDRPTGASGQLRRELLEGCLHALGELTQREVDGLLRAIGMPADRANTPLFYRRLASYTTTEDKQVPVNAVVDYQQADVAAIAQSMDG